MNVKFMNPFVEAANEVLQAEVQLSSRRGNLSLRESSFASEDITVLISLVGQVQGVVIYGLSVDTGKGLVGLSSTSLSKLRWACISIISMCTLLCTGLRYFSIENTLNRSLNF